MNILYINHYGYSNKEFHCDKNGKPQKIIGDGGSNIHIHLIKFLSHNHKITISTYKNNYQIQAFFGKNKNIHILESFTLVYLFGRYSFLLDHFSKTVIFPLKAYFPNSQYKYIFSVTDFLPDVIYSVLIKIKNPQIKWVASFFLEAPKPWSKENPYRKNLVSFFRGVIYWSFQFVSYKIINRWADFVLVTSKPDVKKFVNKKRSKQQVIIVKGGVDVPSAKKYLISKKILPVQKRKYDACFLGRLHPQKGCLELIDIWKIVVKQKPDALLAIIGNGSLEKNIKEKIKEYNLEKNIDLFGFKFGKEKEEIFKNSRIILHPAIYDSGGMSAAEGMAWGLPAVGFNLESLKTYYPQGMLKAAIGNNQEFADKILLLIENKQIYDKISHKARNLAVNIWDWNIRFKYIYNRIFSYAKN